MNKEQVFVSLDILLITNSCVNEYLVIGTLSGHANDANIIAIMVIDKKMKNKSTL